MVVIIWYEIRTPSCTKPTQSIGDCRWTGHAGYEWVALEKWCLLEWAVRRGISPHPLKQWAVGSGSAAGLASTPLSQIRQEEMAPEAARNTHLDILLQTHVCGRTRKCACAHTDTGQHKCSFFFLNTFFLINWCKPSLTLSLFRFIYLITVCSIFQCVT